MVVGGLVLTVYAGLLNPWVKTVVITTFLIESRTDTPDSETIESLTSRSKKFSELLERAETEAVETAGGGIANDEIAGGEIADDAETEDGVGQPAQ